MASILRFAERNRNVGLWICGVLMLFGGDYCAFGQNRSDTEEAMLKSIDRAVECMKHIGSRLVVQKFETECDPERIGRYAALIANCRPLELVGLKKAEHRGVAVLAEWVLTHRKIEGLWLTQFSEQSASTVNRNSDRNADKPALNELVHDKAKAGLEGFLNILRRKLDCEIPDRWENIVRWSRCEGGYVIPDVQTRTSFADGMNDEGSEIELERNVAVIKSLETKKIFIVTIPHDVSREEIIGCAFAGEFCILAVNLPAEEPGNDVEILAFKHNVRDSLWVTRCAQYWDDESLVGSGGLVLFTAASWEHKSYVVFVSHPGGFGVDVLDIETGKRKWCFFSVIPTVLK